VSQLEIPDDHALTMQDIEAYLARLPGEITLLACISVWDGYRELMAQTNGLLGATNLNVTSVTRLRDKLTMRRWLHRDRLSRVQPQSGNEAPLLDQRLFVQEGDRLPEIAREIFIGQALWDISALPHHTFSDFAASTAHHFQVEYQA
jgi:hypothetical protein